MVWVGDLREDLVMPGRDKPIARSAVDRLINKFTEERIILGAGRGKNRAYVTKEVAAKVREYFDLKHK